jgi:hypothetical protein
LGVVEQLSVDGVGDPALEQSDRFEGSLAFRSLASVPCRAVQARGGDRGRQDLEKLAKPTNFLP